MKRWACWHGRIELNPEEEGPVQTMPHCDSAILHSPGACQYCDAHPDWQELRELWRINFSDQDDPEKAPCPSTFTRTAEKRDRWFGNVARPVDDRD